VGAIGGAASGFMLGNAILPGIGGAVGGIAGFVGGIIGAGDAARAAAERLRKAKEAFDTAFESAKAEVAGDQLALQIAQTHAQYDQLRDALKDATPWLQRMIGSALNLGNYATSLADVNRLEQERIAQLKEEAEAQRRYFTEDLRVRELRAKGQTKEADALEFQNKQQRELDEYRRTHVMDDSEQGRQNQAQFAYLQYVQSLEKNTAAVTDLTKSMQAFNTPTGYKVESRLFQYATPEPRPAGLTPSLPRIPSTPLTPPTQPLLQEDRMWRDLVRDPMQDLSRALGDLTTALTPGTPAPAAPATPVAIRAQAAPAASRSVTLQFNIDGTKTTRTLVTAIAGEVRKVVDETFGKDAQTVSGWDLLA
jgi:hypothetical protein